jgi:hypothetical protein
MGGRGVPFPVLLPPCAAAHKYFCAVRRGGFNAGNGYSLKKVVPRLWRDGQTSQGTIANRVRAA